MTTTSEWRLFCTLSEEMIASNGIRVWILTLHLRLVYLVLHLTMHYYAFENVSLLWLAFFLSHDYFSAVNSLGFLNIFYVSLWRRSNARNVRLTLRFGSFINILIFRFVSLHCLRRTLRLFLLLVNLFIFWFVSKHCLCRTLRFFLHQNSHFTCIDLYNVLKFERTTSWSTVR